MANSDYGRPNVGNHFFNGRNLVLALLDALCITKRTKKGRYKQAKSAQWQTTTAQKEEHCFGFLVLLYSGYRLEQSRQTKKTTWLAHGFTKNFGDKTVIQLIGSLHLHHHDKFCQKKTIPAFPASYSFFQSKHPVSYKYSVSTKARLRFPYSHDA